MHLSFVVVGAALAPSLDLPRLFWTIVAFFLAMGLAAHALDELKGRPLQTDIGTGTLILLAIGSLIGASGIGIWGAIHYDLLPGLVLVAVGVSLVVSYNLELLGGRIHNDLGFAAAWGAFPVLVAYFAQTGVLDLVAAAGATYAFTASLMQRRLSTTARTLRRRTERIEGTILGSDGQTTRITSRFLLESPEQALRGLVALTALVALTLVAAQAPSRGL